MESKTLAGYVMALTVSIICVAAILVPTINDATSTVTMENEGLYHMQKYGSDAELSLQWDYTNPGYVTIGDDTVEIQPSGVSKTMMAGWDAFVIVFDSTNVFQVYDDTSDSSRLTAGVPYSTNLTVTVAEGVLTATNGTNTYTKNITQDFYCIADEGDYVLKGEDSTAYLREDDTFYITTRVTSPFTQNCTVTGSIADGFTVTGMYYEITSSNHEVNYTASAYKGLYEFTGVTFDGYVTIGNNQYGGEDGVLKQFIVPATVSYTTGTLVEYAGLLSVIPIVIIAAIVLGSVSLVGARRD